MINLFEKSFKYKLICVCILLFSCVLVFSQEALPLGYRDIKLGMHIDDVKNALLKDSVFGYRGDRDVSLLPTENRVLIETSSESFLQQCWFQFYQENLYSIILSLNTEKMDFYSVFTKLTNKYGEPDVFSPDKVLWQDENVMMSLERPLTIKYISVSVFEELRGQEFDEKTSTEMLREDFLNSF